MRVLTEILFPGGEVRLETALGLGAFGVLALHRHDWRPLAAAVAWMVGFEAAYVVAVKSQASVANGAVHAAFWVGVGGAASWWLARKGVRPSLPFLVGAITVWAVWVATGFHVNIHSGADFQIGPEILNEVAKGLWWAAYFIPLLHALPEAHAERGARHAAPADLRAERGNIGRSG